MKKQILLLLQLLIIGNTILTGCGSETGAESVSQTGNPDSSFQSIKNDQTEASPLYDDIPVKNYDGYSFRVMTSISNYAITYMGAEEENGDIINDTIHKRNLLVEETLNIIIKEEIGEDYMAPQKKLKQMVASGDDLFDIMFSESNISAPSAADNYMYNLYDISDIDWSKPWWEKSIQKFYSINGKLYFTHTPMQLHYYESLVTLLFNKEIANQYQLEDLYNTVKEGRWTLDKMANLSTNIVTDLNGDSVIKPKDDLYGFTASTNLVVYMALASDCRFTVKNEDGTLYFTGVTDRLIGSVEKLSKIFSNSDNYVENGDYIKLFEDGHSLFFLDVLGRVKDFRNLKADFGILPMPKYDEAQQDYISANFVGASLLIVPTTNNEYMNIGVILECLGAYSYRDLIPAYYEVNIRGKQTRDEESIEMLDIMLSNISGDLSLVYGWGGLTNVYLTAVKSGMEIASTFEKIEKKINTEIEKWKEAF